MTDQKIVFRNGLPICPICLNETRVRMVHEAPIPVKRSVQQWLCYDCDTYWIIKGDSEKGYFLALTAPKH